jgi:hypothetical protein
MVGILLALCVVKLSFDVVIGGIFRVAMIFIRSFGEVVSGAKAFCPTISVSSCGSRVWFLLCFVGLLSLPVELPMCYKIWFNASLFGYGTSSLERFIKLQIDEIRLQAFEARRAHSIQPPPLPDPVISIKGLKLLRKAKLDNKQAHFEHCRLAKRLQQRTVTELDMDDCIGRAQLCYLPFFYILLVKWLLGNAPSWCHAIGFVFGVYGYFVTGVVGGTADGWKLQHVKVGTGAQSQALYPWSYGAYSTWLPTF